MSSAPAAAPRQTFWQRRVRAPLLALLTQGATPEKLAEAIAWSAALSLFPIFGLTTGANAVVALWRGLNQALMQAINYALGPVHILMIVVYVRLGEWLWRADNERFTVTELIASFHALKLGAFLQKFGWAGVHAVSAWLVTAPVLFFAAFAIARPALRHLVRYLPAGDSRGTPLTPDRPNAPGS